MTETLETEEKSAGSDVFPVVAYRYGMRDDHSYLVGVYATRELAERAAEAEVMDRGGKYGCEVIQAAVKTTVDESVHEMAETPLQVGYHESPFFGLLGQGHQCADGRDCAEARDKRREAVRWYLDETRLPVGLRRVICKAVRVLTLRWLWEERTPTPIQTAGRIARTTFES